MSRKLGPYHYLGHSSFRTEFLHRIQEIDLVDALVAMGYCKEDQKAQQRLESVVASPVFDLDVPDTDLELNPVHFLHSLCQYLKMDPDAVEKEIDRLQKGMANWKNAFSCFLWLDTGFKRTHQSIQVLSATQDHRHIELGKTLGFLDMNEQIDEVQKVIAQHQHETDGDAGLWGIVKSYLFYYGPDSAIRLSTTGEILEHYQEGISSNARGNKILDLAV